MDQTYPNDPSPIRSKMMKIDLHCHTEASYDCITKISLFPQRCQSQDIRVQAITDHNEVWGAQKLMAFMEETDDSPADTLEIIVGEEITTSEGEIIGLFLNEKIPAGLSPQETVQEIKAQGGLVLLPHGFDPLKRKRLTAKARARIADSIDIVETFNARISWPYFNRAAATWAKERGILTSAGSDAHTLADIGSAWVTVPARPIHGPDDLLTALREGNPTGEWTQPVPAFFYKVWDFVRHMVFSH